MPKKCTQCKSRHSNIGPYQKNNTVKHQTIIKRLIFLIVFLVVILFVSNFIWMVK